MKRILGKKLFQESFRSYKVFSYQYEGYWTDIGNISSFFEANLGLTDEIPKFNLFDSHHSIFTRPRMLPPSKILGTTLDKTVIAEGCILQADDIKHAVIGIRARIGTGTKIENAYIMGSDRYQTLIEIQEETDYGRPLDWCWRKMRDQKCNFRQELQDWQRCKHRWWSTPGRW